MNLAIACWSMVHGYSTLLINGALDFVEAENRPGIGDLTRFIGFGGGQATR